MDLAFKNFQEPEIPEEEDDDEESIGKSLQAFFFSIINEYKSRSVFIQNTLNDPKKREDGIVYILVSGNHPVLKDSPSTPYFDMRYIYGVAVRDKKKLLGIMRITNAVAEDFGYTEDFLYEKAKENTPKIFPVFAKEREDLSKLFNGLINKEKISRSLLCTNSIEAFGAAAAFYDGTLERFSDEDLVKDLYIFPVSLRLALICFVDGKMTKKDLKYIMKTISFKKTDRTNFLSNTVLKYNKETGDIEPL